jgi:hypothetical protein
MPTHKQPLSCAAGEHLVLGELLKRGVEAYLAHGTTQPGWDVAVVRPAGTPLRVQVKAINWPNEAAVNGKFNEGFNFLVVVLLNGSKQSRFIVIPHAELKQYLSKPNPDRGDARTLTVGRNYRVHKSKNLKQYEGKWNLILKQVSSAA